MSSAKKGKYEFSSCLHVRKFIYDFFHRAKSVSEKMRSVFERGTAKQEERSVFERGTAKQEERSV